MTTQNKKTVGNAVTKKQYENALQAHATAQAEGEKLIAKREAEYQKISEKYDHDIEKHKADAQKAFDTVYRYAEANRDELFGDQQSIDTPYGKLVFRKSPGKLVLPEDVEKLINKFKAKGLALYVVSTEAIDKKKLITDITADPKVQRDMEKLGVTVEVPETFSIK